MKQEITLKVEKNSLRNLISICVKLLLAEIEENQL